MNQPLLIDLEQRTQAIILALREFNKLPEDMLTWKPDEHTWSMLECLEHLRYYGEFYIPEIKKSLDGARAYRSAFRSGWLGGYFANMMKPGTKKISTFKSMNPNGKDLSTAVLTQFMEQQEKLLELLHRADDCDLNRNKAGVSIAPWLTLRLGDIFRVVIYHNERHILQAKRVQALYPEGQAST